MVGWGTEQTDIENPQKVASSEGEELYVGNFRPCPLSAMSGLTV